MPGKLHLTFYRVKHWGLSAERNWWGEWHFVIGPFYLGIEWKAVKHAR